MAELTLHKVEVAARLLDRALVLYLDGHDDLSALVLAGSAEDIFQGILKQSGQGHMAARASISAGAAAVYAKLAPGEPVPPLKHWIETMRGPFNWIRHADDPDDPVEFTADWAELALQALWRAMNNMVLVTNDLPLRANEVSQRIRVAAEAAAPGSTQ